MIYIAVGLDNSNVYYEGDIPEIVVLCASHEKNQVEDKIKLSRKAYKDGGFRSRIWYKIVEVEEV